MGRIADEEVEELKQRVPIEALVTAHGVVLKRHGADLVGLCPFHEDHSPSLVVSPRKNLWNCLGACRMGGSVIDWVMKTEAVEFREAVKKLRDLRLSSRSKGRAAVMRSAIDVDAEEQKLLAEISDYYHRSLKESPEALAYLAERGLVSTEMIEHFKIGFSNETVLSKLPSKENKAGAALRARISKLGLVQRNGREFFQGSIIIPLFDAHGAVVGMYGRRISPPASKETPVHRYLPGPHRGIFNAEIFGKTKDIILCEALIDALTFWCAGFRNVTSSYGVSGFTKELAAAICEHGVERVFIAYDRDDAGDRAAEAIAKKLSSEGVACFRVEFPKGMDANEYGRKLKPASRSLALALKKARSMNASSSPAAVNPYAALDLTSIDQPAQPSTANHAPIEPSAVETAPSAEPTHSLVADPAPSASPTSVIAERAPAVEALIAEPVPTDSSAGQENVAASIAPRADVDAERRAEEIVLRFGDRRYRIRGLEKNLSADLLKVNVLVARQESYFVDTVDLYSARQRAAYVKQAAIELGVEEEIIKKDLAKILLKLEEIQAEQIKEALESKTSAVQLSPAEQKSALELLNDPKLLERILADFERCGIVGEETNKLVGYVAAVSRKLEDPLAVIIQSSTAAGKSSLMEAILSFMPDEDRVKYSAMTGQSLFYMGETNLKHKILAIVEEEGAERASYALKLLQSERELTIASTGKDPTTGRLVTQEYRVEGPVMLFLTTTAIDIDDELLNRCIVLTVDEDRSQTQAIHRLQRKRETLEGLLARRERDRVLKLHRDAQRLLRPVFVVNPFAERLTFLDHRTRMRRDHMKYLVLIRTIVLLFQYQRELKTIERNGEIIEYVEATLEDIATANRLAHQVLGRTLDELPPQTKRLLALIDEMVKTACAQQSIDRSNYRFTRRDVRESTGWGDTQLKVHLRRLEELEYLLVKNVRGQRFEYELVYDGRGADGASFVSGLIDPERLTDDRAGFFEDRSGSTAARAGVGRREVGEQSAGVASAEIQKTIKSSLPLAADAKSLRKNARPRKPANGAVEGAIGTPAAEA